jgi:rubredoxin
MTAPDPKMDALLRELAAAPEAKPPHVCKTLERDHGAVWMCPECKVVRLIPGHVLGPPASAPPASDPRPRRCPAHGNEEPCIVCEANHEVLAEAPRDAGPSDLTPLYDRHRALAFLTITGTPTAAQTAELSLLRLAFDALDARDARLREYREALGDLPCMFVWQGSREGKPRTPCDDTFEPIPEHAWCPNCLARARALSRRTAP